MSPSSPPFLRGSEYVDSYKYMIWTYATMCRTLIPASARTILPNQFHLEYRPNKSFMLMTFDLLTYANGIEFSSRFLWAETMSTKNGSFSTCSAQPLQTERKALRIGSSF